MNRNTLPRILSAILVISILLPGISFALNGTDYSAYTPNAQEGNLLQLLNEDRARYGLGAYVLDPELSRVARAKSQDMLDNKYFAHTSPTYGSIKDMLNTMGVKVQYASENIARSRSVSHANAAFLSSASHRRNMLSKVYTHVGIGVVVTDAGFVYVTEIFTVR